jgi:hypothetical protein
MASSCSSCAILTHCAGCLNASDVSTANLLCGFQKLLLSLNVMMSNDCKLTWSAVVVAARCRGLSELQGALQGQHQSREMLRLIASYRVLASPFSCGCSSSVSTLHVAQVVATSLAAAQCWQEARVTVMRELNLHRPPS